MITFNRLWHMLSEPRVVTAFFLTIYTVFLIQGVQGLLVPPHPHDEQVQTWTRLLVNGSLVAGGLVGVASTPRGLWQFERAAILFVMAASAVQLFWTVFDPDPGVRWVSLWRSVTILLFLGARYYTIRWARADPGK
ncbi:hypothetical protein E4U03_04595 [Rothia nasimurium]|uniref:Uncharacterized protein n=1 Tax=Rothia nasimurium TaxID=85336 RepID=A0A4Y9F5P5_9MICC|nr:hypothetical protein [Rothia nasimurium]MBF0807897.1 hypothetical protein [Rothia nasimurium]TFU22899.1 hypothetical protein E4U03_04595 [Rothia nasimurium]